MKLPFLASVVPPHVFCLQAEGVTYASVRRETPAGFAQSRHFAYPPNTVGVGGAGTPLLSREAVAESVEAGRRLSDGRLSRASVVFPDSWARMLPIDFESLPDSDTAVREMVSWKLKKLFPGVSADLTIVFREMSGVGAGRRLLVATVPTQTLESIEKSFESVGVRVGALLPASLALFEGFSPTLSARARGDYALIHRAPGSLVFLVAKDGAPIFFRQRPSDEAGHDHEQEIRLSLSYYTEKLGGKGLAAAFAHDETPSESRLAEAFPVPVEPLSGHVFGADSSFDQLVGARPELLAAFAAAYTS
jgi:hypothetical protein